MINLKHLATPAPTQLKLKLSNSIATILSCFFFSWWALAACPAVCSQLMTLSVVHRLPVHRVCLGEHRRVDMTSVNVNSYFSAKSLITITVSSFFSINEFPDVSVKIGSVRPMPPHLVGSSLFPTGIQSLPSPWPGPKLAPLRMRRKCIWNCMSVLQRFDRSLRMPLVRLVLSRLLWLRHPLFLGIFCFLFFFSLSSHYITSRCSLLLPHIICCHHIHTTLIASSSCTYSILALHNPRSHSPFCFFLFFIYLFRTDCALSFFYYFLCNFVFQ